jgi:hypothetical protein
MSTNPFGVRKATPHDADQLAEIVPLILAETALLPMSTLKVAGIIERCIYQDGALAGVIDGEDGIAASVGLCPVDDPISDHRYIRGVWCGISPKARKAPPKTMPVYKDPRRHYGRQLFSFVRWAHETMSEAAGHPLLFLFEITTVDEMYQKMDLYQRNMPQVGGIFAMGAQGEFRRQTFKFSDQFAEEWAA